MCRLSAIQPMWALTVLHAVLPARSSRCFRASPPSPSTRDCSPPRSASPLVTGLVELQISSILNVLRGKTEATNVTPKREMVYTNKHQRSGIFYAYNYAGRG